jgi:hypothetical protein
VSKEFLVEQKFPVEVPAMLADPIDFRTGEFLSIEQGYDPTDGAVFTALRTVRGTGSAVQDVGQKFHEHQRVDPQLEPFMREETSFALQHLTETRQIELESVGVLMDDDYAELQLKYFNVAEQQQRIAQARTTELVGRR